MKKPAGRMAPKEAVPFSLDENSESPQLVEPSWSHTKYSVAGECVVPAPSASTVREIMRFR
ncbi:MAG: hypothetical protein GX621_04370 [Pirellulaceae bacterium]|nr:hypothetical protein [Pirellulaceae bacterium]